MKWHSEILIPFITLRCNFKCEYCITRFSPDYDFTFSELPGKKWIDFINGQDNVNTVVFNGGEPTIHPHFPDIINSLKPLKLLAIGTNYSKVATAALLKITPRDSLILDGSFHPHFISHHDISQNLLRLKDAGFKVRVHFLDYPGFKVSAADVIRDFYLQGIDAFVQSYEGFYQGTFYHDQMKIPYCGLESKSRCLCSRSIYTPIAPNGDMYFCHYLMYSKADFGLLGNIDSPPYEFPVDLDCPHLGYCSPCDWPRSIKVNP